MAPDLYDALGVDAGADADAVAAAYRERAAALHPDVNDHPRAREQFTLVTAARDVLTDPDERAAYDRLGHETYVERHLDRSLPPPTVLDGVAPDDGGAPGDDPSTAASDPAEDRGTADSGAPPSDASTASGPGAGRRKRPADAGRATREDGPGRGPGSSSASRGSSPDKSTRTTIRLLSVSTRSPAASGVRYGAYSPPPVVARV